MSEGRTSKAIRNSKYALIMKFSETLLAFVLRTVFIHTLSTVYLGLNGIFTNILTVLSLMDLGVGSAISFSLYKPLADNDRARIVALMQLYKKLYRVIGLLVCGIGFLLTPFLKHIINLPEDVPHIYLIYWLNIGNTAITYFLAYKRTLLIADQRSYINYQNAIIFKFTRFAALALILILTHNFILYLAADILNTFVSNLVISRKVSKLYPYLKSEKPDTLSKEETGKIWKYMKAGLFNKIGQTVVTSTDNIVISAFISTVIVGYYSNYLLLINGFETVTFLIFSNITSSVGNLTSAKDVSIHKTKEIFQVIQTINHIISTIACVGLVALINPFIELWVGKECVLPQSAIIICIINLYITLNTNCISNFMGAQGELYYINRYRPLIEAVINLATSIVLVKFTNLGIVGVFLGTTVSFLFGRIWMDAFVLYKNWFKEKFIHYVIDYSVKALITALLSVACWLACNRIIGALGINILVFAVLVMLVIVITVAVLILVYFKTDAFKYMINMILTKLGRRK